MNEQPMRDFVVGFQANQVNEVKCKGALKCPSPPPPNVTTLQNVLKEHMLSHPEMIEILFVQKTSGIYNPIDIW